MDILESDFQGSSQEGTRSTAEKSFHELTPQHLVVHDFVLMNRIHSIVTAFIQEVDISDILLEIIDTAMSISTADKGSILLVDEKTENLKITASRGFDAPFLDYFASCPPGEGACGTALQNNERVIIYNITEDPRFINTPYLAQLLAKEIHSVQATPLKSRTGKILGVLATYYKKPTLPEAHELQMVDLLSRLSADIIERNQLIAERAILIEKLREADKRKNEFLALLSHELRNPLAAISNSAVLLSYSSGECPTVKNVQAIINRQVTQITRLVDDLLDITRIIENKIQISLQKIDLNELVFRVVEDNRLSYERAGLSLIIQLAEGPVFIHGDALRIEQVINNLLHNASKFSNYGGMTQVVVEVDKKNNEAIIRVLDDGIGIAPSFIDQLFLPFTQADTSMERAQAGLGLGLALIKGLIELHHGSVHAVSAGLGHGAEFIIKLPLHEEDEHLFDQQAPAYQVALSRTILIIDDNADIRDSLSMLLETLGHQVYVESTGRAGIAKARETRPDFVLCDIGLPELNGYQVAKAFREDPILESTYLIAISGYVQPEEIIKAKQAGFDNHLAKPFNFDLLQDILVAKRLHEEKP
ncbi:ATP-binding protein [Legionella sp. km772]|uniref:hybrid sensor histidine kinase/response regulator n=1 Tax=Legionella sp. km772 TaxID=2498111 RepID=UPI000F8C4C57|nr:ATP-binding protein [Legionella sp. km772]RUR09438.1 response regulator [Legionella sp. km772]